MQTNEVLERAVGFLLPAPQWSFRTSNLKPCESILYAEQTLFLIRDKYERLSLLCEFKSGLADAVTFTSGE